VSAARTSLQHGDSPWLARAESTVKPRPHQQQCRNNIVECYMSNTATMSNEISSFRQSRNKLNMFNLFRLCQKDGISFDIVAETGNIVEATFEFVERTKFYDRLVRHCCRFRGSRSDRPRYCVTTPTRAEHWPWPMTLAFNCRRTKVMIARTNTEVRKSVGSIDRVESWKHTNGQTDRRTDGRTDRRTLPTA